MLPFPFTQARLGKVATNSSFPISWSAKRVWEPVMTLLSPLLHFCLMSDHWRPGAMSGHRNTNICGAGAN